jgi:BMFP domain-containing protein YqiC
MTHTTDRIADEFAKFMTDAAGFAQGMKREADTFVKTQAERFLRDMDLPSREEFEAVREMAVKAREENEALRARIDALEAAIQTGAKTKKGDK